MKQAQVSLESLLIMILVVAITAIVVTFVINSSTAITSTAQFNSCRAAASQCAVSLLSSSVACISCDISCTDNSGADIISGYKDLSLAGATFLCRNGKALEIYPGKVITLEVESVEPPPASNPSLGYEINSLVNDSNSTGPRSFGPIRSFGGGGGGGGGGAPVPSPQPQPEPVPEPKENITTNTTGNTTGNETVNATENVTSSFISVALILPEDGNLSGVSSVNFTFYITASTNITNVSLWTNQSSSWESTSLNTSPLANSSIHGINRTLSDGSYVWNIHACDIQGNCTFSISNRSLTVNTTPPIPPDTTPPTVTLSYSPSSPYQNQMINITVVAMDDTGVSTIWLATDGFWVSGCTFEGASANCVGAPPLTCDIMPGGVSCEYHFYSSIPGDYVLSAYAIDTSNNTQFSQNQTVTVLPNETNVTLTLGFLNNFNFSTSGKDIHPTGIAWNGTYFWVLVQQSKKIYQFSYGGVIQKTNYRIGGRKKIASPTNMYLDNDTFYITNNDPSDPSVHTVAYSNGNYLGSAFSTSQEPDPRAIWLKNDSWYILGGKATVYEYDISGSYTGNSFNISQQDTDMSGLVWDGFHWWALGSGNKEIYRYYENFTYTNYSFPTTPGETRPEGLGLEDESLWHGGNSGILYRYTPYWY
jgi:hypothetical protein